MNSSIYIATQNQHKIKEIQSIFKKQDCKYSLYYINDLDQKLQNQYQPIESGNSFLQNAYIKALALYKLIKKPIISEDSGLVVEDLNGEPGIYSARYAPTQKEQNLKVLNKLKAAGSSQRKAYFMACLCLLTTEHDPVFFYGTLKGTIAHEEKGKNGFGYDPIFFYPLKQCTLGEISEEEKNQISHRKQALDQCIYYLKKLS